MVQGVRAGGRFFLGNGMLDPIDYSGDFDRRTGLRREEAPFRRTTSTLREVDEQQRRRERTAEERQQSLPVQMRLGSRPLHEVSRALQPRFQHGGTFLRVEDGPLTFEQGEESITIEPGAAARFFRSGREEITIQDRETGDELALQAGQQVEITGEGRADFGVLSPFELTPGEEFTVEQTEEGPAVVSPDADRPQVIEPLEDPPEIEGPLQMEVFRDPETDQLRELYYRLVQQPLAEEEEEEEESPTLAELMEENSNPGNSPANPSNSNSDAEPEAAEENSINPEGSAEEIPVEAMNISPLAADSEAETAENNPDLSTLSRNKESEQLAEQYSFEQQSTGDALNLYA